MKISQKKTCNGCRATGPEGHCALGCKTKMVSATWGRVPVYIPAEPCLKPKSVQDYLLAIKL